MTMIHSRIRVNRYLVASLRERKDMHDLELTAEMAAVIKLARSQNIPYSWITGYYPGLNFGRIADVMGGRRFAEVPPAPDFPPDFPVALAA
ncbi:hypothetical protein [Hoeflea ulvae]